MPITSQAPPSMSMEGCSGTTRSSRQSSRHQAWNLRRTHPQPYHYRREHRTWTANHTSTGCPRTPSDWTRTWQGWCYGNPLQRWTSGRSQPNQRSRTQECHPRSHGCGSNNSSTGIRAIPVIEKVYSKQYKPDVATTKSSEPACRK
jgi:hypothetical protein